MNQPSTHRPAAAVGLRHVAAATILALAGSTLVAGPAGARVSPDPAPRDGGHYPASIVTTVPPGGASMITTPTLGKGVDTLKITVKPKNEDELGDEIYDNFTHTLGLMAKGKRLMVCLMVYQSVVAPGDQYGENHEVNALHATVAGAVLLACLQLAGLLQRGDPARDLPRAVGQPAAGAAETCEQARPSLPATVENTGNGFTVNASGTTKKARKPKLRIGCKVKGHTMTYKVRAARKGVPLRKVVGKQLRLGLQSPSDASKGVKVKVTFATP